MTGRWRFPCGDYLCDTPLMSFSITEACVYVSEALAAAANPEKAVGMQAYMKTDMPFYGVQKRGRTPVLRRLVSESAPADRDQYENLVLALWELPHREEKYLARGLAVSHKQYMVPESLPLFRRMITEGAWWALREYTKTDADLVAGFVNDHREELSGLSFREATKHIGHLVDR